MFLILYMGLGFVTNKKLLSNTIKKKIIQEVILKVTELLSLCRSTCRGFCL